MAVRPEIVYKWIREPYYRETIFKWTVRIFLWAFRGLFNKKTVDRETVQWAFRTLLDREPESEKFVNLHRKAASLPDLVENIVNSVEFRLRYINRDSLRLVNQMLSDQEAHVAVPPTASLEIILLQTSDAQRYFPLLACGRTANEHYAIKNGFSYSAYIGIKRGYHPWHAAFNRLFMLKELSAAGYRGWAFYIDADAYVRDQSFDLRQFLAQHPDKSLIAASGGRAAERWNINDGVFLINLGHADARRLIDLWHWHFMAMTDAALREASEWDDVRNDQTCLHEILQANPHLLERLHIENHTFQDIGHTGFVRQVMRSPNVTLEARLQQMRRDIAELKLPTEHSIDAA